MSFKLIHKDPNSSARAGSVHTAHGVFETPVFMPVGTIGSVKAVSQQDLVNDVKAQIILGNTYHLYIRPGMDTMGKAEGLHKFMHCNLPILTDSGGFQVYSLSPTRKIREEGVEFTSYLDGSKHFFTPEKVLDIQRIIGSDIMMPLDECTPYPADYKYVKDSIALTHRWLKRSADHYRNRGEEDGIKQLHYGIVQGGVYSDLRQESAKAIVDMDLDGNAIGGLSVGEPAEEMYAMTERVCAHLPENKPRYLMGVGTPENLLESVALGIDMFDCVMPTRNGRNGWLFTSNGVVNLMNSKWKDDFSALDPDGTSYVDTYYSKAYVRHLHHSREILGPQISSIHNLAFYVWLMKEARKHILEGDFTSWKKDMVKRVTTRL
ncbi:MAG TPA: tRNA guanosine(34) transglycosylase Tgt [Bacteroidia bacterium]|nr:tRNA guanosine(34) transglycosylase Tgt [Bacteroidia bacterium]